MHSDRKKVLITGAGPTGFTMANLLARMDIPFLLIDKNAQPALDSKAFGIHARTLEIFDHPNLLILPSWRNSWPGICQFLLFPSPIRYLNAF